MVIVDRSMSRADIEAEREFCKALMVLKRNDPDLWERINTPEIRTFPWSLLKIPLYWIIFFLFHRWAVGGMCHVLTLIDSHNTCESLQWSVFLHAVLAPLFSLIAMCYVIIASV